MNPTRHNHLFSYDRKAELNLLKSKIPQSPIFIVEEITYKAPRKLSNIEKHNWSKWLESEFPKVKPA